VKGQQVEAKMDSSLGNSGERIMESPWELDISKARCSSPALKITAWALTWGQEIKVGFPMFNSPGWSRCRKFCDWKHWQSCPVHLWWSLHNHYSLRAEEEHVGEFRGTLGT
jgi:hypothetical protein